MKETSGLRDLGLFQVFVRTFKHNDSYTVAKDFIGFIEKILCLGILS